MGQVAGIVLVGALLEMCAGCARPPQAPANVVTPIIGLPPIQIDTSRPGLDVRDMPAAEVIAATERTVRVPAEVEAARLERRPVSMGYPAAARVRRLAGHVKFRVIVGPDGSVQGLTVLEATDQVFLPIATASVQSWLYRPYVMGGKAVAVDTTVRVEFAP